MGSSVSHTILVFGVNASDPGRFMCPQGVAVHQLTDMIYVADQDYHRMCEFNSSGHILSCRLVELLGYCKPPLWPHFPDTHLSHVVLNSLN